VEDDTVGNCGVGADGNVSGWLYVDIGIDGFVINGKDG
jgi:hypothetical protein